MHLAIFSVHDFRPDLTQVLLYSCGCDKVVLILYFEASVMPYISTA